VVVLGEATTATAASKVLLLGASVLRIWPFCKEGRFLNKDKGGGAARGMPAGMKTGGGRAMPTCG